MISIQEAKSLIHKHSIQRKEIQKPLIESLGFVLSQEIISPINLPLFNQSAMDGYAICSENNKSKTFKLISEVKAGDVHNIKLKKGECVRIFTGAMIPENATAVIMQEKVKAEKGCIIIQEEVKNGDNIRLIGEQINKGDVALKKGAYLNPACIGFLSGLGITHVNVFNKPSITLVITGNELTPPTKQLEKGKIYESNSLMISSALKSSNFKVYKTLWVKDDLGSTIQTLKKASEQSDIILISGGISVGDYDYVSKALQQMQVEKVFHKVNQKPGKPFYFGKQDKTLFFGLPGNPSASLVCFYYYIIPALRKIAGVESSDLEKKDVISQSNFIKKGDRPQFLKAIVKHNKAQLLDGQSSAMLHTFSIANFHFFFHLLQSSQAQ